jgi:hypothetical protein
MSLPIVGIGASAGGLESFSELLARLPADTGMAYVFVQHLDPGYASRLVEILSKRVRFPVEQAREGAKILPDRLYVIAPNTTLTLGGGVLHLRSRDPAERPHRPVDAFFHFACSRERAQCHWHYPFRERNRRNKRYSSGQTGSGNHFRAGQEFCSLLWNAKQRHSNGMRRFYSKPWRHRAGANKHQSSSLTLEGQIPIAEWIVDSLYGRCSARSQITSR